MLLLAFFGHLMMNNDIHNNENKHRVVYLLHSFYLFLFRHWFTVTMLQTWKDPLHSSSATSSLCSSWAKAVVAILAMWLTITVSLHVFLAGDLGHPAWATRISSEWDRLEQQGQQPSSFATTHHQPQQREVPKLTAQQKLERYAATRNRPLQHQPLVDGGYHQRPLLLRQVVRDKLHLAAVGIGWKQAIATTTKTTPRLDFEKQYPPDDTQRIRSFVASLRDTELDQNLFQSSSQYLPYDPFDCPDTPPPDYPLHYSLVEMLKEWPADQLQWPAFHATVDHPYLYQSLCVFDWDRLEHRQRMRRYQVEYDVPFILRNQPEIMQTTERWSRNDPAYLQALIGNEPQRNEHSFHSNHLPFWRLGKHDRGRGPPGWKAPTENVKLSFAEWSARADALDQAISEGKDHTQLDRYYFRLQVALEGRNNNRHFYDELPWFDPRITRAGENLFMMYPDQERGINCRWGMSGNIAELHYDYSSNWIVLLGGRRRYILAHPRECPNLALFPMGHPSARHSSVNWSDMGPKNDDNAVQFATTEAAQALQSAMAHQVVLQASDALFLPTSWFHFIVSLERNYQCNARSGIRHGNDGYIEDCGFATTTATTNL